MSISTLIALPMVELFRSCMRTVKALKEARRHHLEPGPTDAHIRRPDLFYQSMHNLVHWPSNGPTPKSLASENMLYGSYILGYCTPSLTLSSLCCGILSKSASRSYANHIH